MLGSNESYLKHGDVYFAEITRQDVAEVVVAALLKGSATDNTTFEFKNVLSICMAIYLFYHYSLGFCSSSSWWRMEPFLLLILR